MTSSRRTALLAALALCFAAAARAADRPNDEAEKPVPVKDSLEQFKKALANQTTADIRFDLALGDAPAFLRLKEMPFGVRVDDDKVADYQTMPGRAIVLAPKAAGRTQVRLFFGDRTNAATQWVLTLRVNVKEAAKDAPGKPIPVKESLDRLGKAMAKGEDAEVPFSLTAGQSVAVALKDRPFQVMLLDRKAVDYSVGKPPPPSIILEAKGAGRAPVMLWFGDRKDSAKQFVITLQVRVREEQK